MCIATTPKGLWHNFKTWNFEFCGDFKLMEQDASAALAVFKHAGINDLYDKLSKWDFAIGSFKISKADYSRVAEGIKSLLGLKC